MRIEKLEISPLVSWCGMEVTRVVEQKRMNDDGGFLFLFKMY